MRYADPAVCPSCRSALRGSMQCPSCGLDLSTREAGELWQSLQRADVLLDAALAARPTAPRAAQPTPPTPEATPAPDPTPEAARDPFVTPMPPPQYGPTGHTAPARTAPSWSVGTVLLTLGAFGLVVAAIIFVARSWETIGLGGKVAVLALATALAAAAAVWVTRRPLRASAEALWSVTACVVALDIGGARSEGLAGLDRADGAWIAIVAGAIFAFGAAGVVVWARRHLQRDLISMSLASVAGVLATSVGAAALGDHDEGFWHVFVGLVVCGALGLALRFSGSGVIAMGTRVVLAVFYVVAAGFALDELSEYPALGELVGGGHGVPVLLMSVVTIGVGLAIPSLRIGAGAVAALGLASLVIAPASQIDTSSVGDGEGGLMAAVLLSTVGALVLARGTDAWVRGLRIAVGVLAVASVLLVGWWLLDHVAVLTSATTGGWGFGANPSDGVGGHDFAESIGVLTSVVAALGVLVQAWALPRWPELRSVPPNPVLALAAPAAALGVLISADPSLTVYAALLVIGGLVATVLGRWSGWAHAVAVALIGSAAVLGLVDESSAVWIWPAAALVLAAVTELGRRPLDAISGGALAPLVAGTAVAGCAVADIDSPVPQLLAVLGAALVTGLITLLDRSGRQVDHWTADTVMVTGLISMVVAICSVDTSLQGSAVATVAGAATLALATITRHRAWLLGLGALELVAAYVLLLAAGSVGFIEAYTLPLGVAALAGGWWVRRRRPELSTWVTFGGGLALSLLPSLPQALAEPTSLRALVLGAAAVGLIAVGVRLDWQAPFVFGVVVAGLILLVNIGPYAQAAPRVVIIAVVSTVLVGLGVTWEDRVRDGRRLATMVKGMS